MARGRMISKCISTSEKFNRCPDNDTRLLYLMLIPHTDDFGKMDGKAFWVKGAVVPMIDKFTTDKIDKCLDALCDVGLIRRGEVDGKSVIEIDAFDEHQTGLHKRTESKFPSVPGNSRKFPEIPGDSRLTELNRTEQNLTELNTFAPNDKKAIVQPQMKFQDGKILNISDNDITAWQQAYPAVDIKAQILRAEQWLLSNPNKTKKNYRRFLTGWFSRKQERGGDIPANPITTQTQDYYPLPWNYPYWNPRKLSKIEWLEEEEQYAISQGWNPRSMCLEQKIEAAEHVRTKS